MGLYVKDLTFSYKNTDKKILDGFCAEFPADKITALVGGNGAGKTTLANLIMGILKPESGAVVLDEVDITSDTLAERGRKIGYVMQNPAKQIFSTTVREEMEIGLRNMGLSEEEIVSRSQEYLEYFGLTHHMESFPFSLSHGEKQRLVLAAILAMKPSYLILDEPTANLDFKNRKKLGAYLRDLDCGVIIISHDKTFVKEYCEHIVDMELCKQKATTANSSEEMENDNE